MEKLKYVPFNSGSDGIGRLNEKMDVFLSKINEIIEWINEQEDDNRNDY